MQPEPEFEVVWSGREGLTSYMGQSQLESCRDPTVADPSYRYGPVKKAYVRAPPGGLVVHYRDDCGWTWPRIALALHTHRTTVKRAYDKWKAKA